MRKVSDVLFSIKTLIEGAQLTENSEDINNTRDNVTTKEADSLVIITLSLKSVIISCSRAVDDT